MKRNTKTSTSPKTPTLNPLAPPLVAQTSKSAVSQVSKPAPSTDQSPTAQPLSPTPETQPCIAPVPSVVDLALSSFESSYSTSAAPDHPPLDSIDPLTLSKIESLRRRQRADAFIQSLSDEESNQLFSWFIEFDDLGEVLDRVLAPPPAGLGREVSITSLRRLRSHFRALTTINATQGILDTITDMELQADLTQSTRIQHAISHMLHEHAFEIARTHPGSATMRDLLASIRSLAELDFKRQKLLADHKRHRPQPAQHHRVDLNIVPPPRNPVAIQTHPLPDPAAPQLPIATDNAAGGRTSPLHLVHQTQNSLH